ncbi:MAG: isoquinoline 1-oxidoreductase subunit alpha [Candidatus Eremiobacteraeota bacterium]|nr:isoquinoline 1-oxidoreductase subunit alpha [Candidatus Eremiobacteraeota bacterium]
MPYRLRVNGQVRDGLEVEPDTPLLWVLRDELGLSGTKFGCGIAACGACTVLLDGAPARACVVPVGAVGSAEVVTVEHLENDPLGRRVQDAWVAEDVPQCGYCQSGMVVEATALLREHPHPTRADIERRMNGHVCRCGTYLRIRAAIERAAARA